MGVVRGEKYVTPPQVTGQRNPAKTTILVQTKGGGKTHSETRQEDHTCRERVKEPGRTGGGLEEKAFRVGKQAMKQGDEKVLGANSLYQLTQRKVRVLPEMFLKKKKVELGKKTPLLLIMGEKVFESIRVKTRNKKGVWGGQL